MVRGIRGATTVERDEAQHILERTQALLLEMARANDISPSEMSSICFTMTPDLHATFPAEAARQVGWQYVPVICMRELNVPHGLPMTIRVLMQAETARSQEEVHHIYQHHAVVLREDLVKSHEESQG